MSALQATQSSSSTQAAILAGLNSARETAGADKTDPQDRFLTLLVTQLKNQDPLNPLDNAQVTSQLAQISTVDGIERLNATLQALMTSSSDGQALQAAALVGHGVLVPGSGLALQEGMAIGGVELAEAADRVTVTIKDANGIAVRSLDLGARAAGSVAFSWDGTSDSGAKAADGSYSMTVAATRGDTKVGATALELGIVSSVARSSAGVRLNVGALGVYGLNDVKQIL